MKTKFINKMKITPELVTCLPCNGIFVFGSNPEGRHGAGAAKVAREQFGAKYGIGEGLQGNSYAIPTKDLRVTQNHGYRSIPESQIVASIRKMYEVARQNPTKVFKVAYRNAGIYHYEYPRKLNTLEYCRASTFPTDYNFLDNRPKYLMGMSVPPTMIAQIAERVYEQWLSKL